MILFSRDEAFVQLLSEPLRNAEVIEHLEALSERLNRERVDGIIVDCDDHIEGAQAIAVIKASPASGASPCIAIVNGETQPADAQDRGAWVVFEKADIWKQPGAIERWLRTVRKREHFRFPLREVVLIDSGEVVGRQATMVNVSLGGAMVITHEVEGLEKELTLRLSAGRFPCEIVWREPSGRLGVRFTGAKFTAADLNRLMGATE